MKFLSVAILIASSFALVDFKIGPLKGKCNGNQMMTKENCEDFANVPGRVWRGTFNRDWWQAGCSMTDDASGKSNVYWNRHTGNRFGSSGAKPVCKTGPGCVGLSSGMRYPNDPQKFRFYQPQTLCHKDTDCCNHGPGHYDRYGDQSDIMCSDDGFCIDYNVQEVEDAGENAVEEDVGVETGYVSYNWKKVPDVQVEGRACIRPNLMSGEECKAFAATPGAGRTFRNQPFDRDNWPQGCVMTEDGTDKNVYFNTNAKNPKFFKPKAKAVCNYWVKDGVHHFGIFSVEHSSEGYSLVTYGLASIGVFATVYGAYAVTKKVMAE